VIGRRKRQTDACAGRNDTSLAETCEFDVNQLEASGNENITLEEVNYSNNSFF